MSTSLTKITLMFRYGASFFLGTLLFPRALRQSVLTLYQFVRIPDQIVDGEVQSSSQKLNHLTRDDLQTHYTQAHVWLKAMLDERTRAYDDHDTVHTTRWEYVQLFDTYQIPLEYSQSFFQAMLQDCTIHRYSTYAQLQGYMYGSASVVGLMMCSIVGYDISQESSVHGRASHLGNAMQLTNFLRDIKEDYNYLDRIYIPTDILSTYGLSHDHIQQRSRGGYHQADPLLQQSRKNCMQEMISLCREWYHEWWLWLSYLHPTSRSAIQLASSLYAGILDRIEHVDYDVFSNNCRTTLWEKLSITLRHLQSKKSDFIIWLKIFG